MYPKKELSSPYLLVFLFKDPGILFLVLLFAYTLPCFHPKKFLTVYKFYQIPHFF